MLSFRRQEHDIKMFEHLNDVHTHNILRACLCNHINCFIDILGYIRLPTSFRIIISSPHIIRRHPLLLPILPNRIPPLIPT